MSVVGTRREPENQEQQSIKQVMIALTGAFNKLNLYSEKHGIYQNALNLLHKPLNDHFDKFANLRIEIERGRIRHGGETVYQGKTEPTDLSFILYRDGILWINFQQGLSLWELDTFLGILHRHIRSEDNFEDDVVTELWAYNMPSIAYEAADLDLGSEDIIQLAALQSRTPCHEDTPEENRRQADSDSENGRTAPAIDPNLFANQDIEWQLTPAERMQLRKMIAEEEKLNGRDYVIDVLLYILEQQVQPNQDVSELLECLMQELHQALFDGRYAYLRIVLYRLKKYVKSLKFDNHVSTPILEKFYASLSGEVFINSLSAISEHIEVCEASEIKELKQALLLLDNSAIRALGPLLLAIPSPKLYQVIMETIGSMAARDFHPLEKLLNSCPAELLQRLVIILGYLKDNRSRRMLSRLLHSETDAVRKVALKAILKRDTEFSRDWVELIEDPEPDIRRLLFDHLGQQRSRQAEDALLSYLETHRFRTKDENELLAVYTTLGKCGSDRSIAFLKKQVFSWPSLGLLRPGSSRRRRAAVAALQELHTAEAAALMEKTRSGFLANIFRRA